MEQALYQASISTFEDLGLMFPIEGTEEITPPADAVARVGVRFSGGFTGQIILEVEECVLPAIASNMLGEDGPVEPQMMQDALGEMANVICGNALPAIAGRSEVFKLESPKSIDRPLGTPRAKAHLLFEEGKANVYIFVD